MELIKLSLLNSFNIEHKVISLWKQEKGREMITTTYTAFNIWPVDSVITYSLYRLKYAINKTKIIKSKL